MDASPTKLLDPMSIGTMARTASGTRSPRKKGGSPIKKGSQPRNTSTPRKRNTSTPRTASSSPGMKPMEGSHNEPEENEYTGGLRERGKKGAVDKTASKTDNSNGKAGSKTDSNESDDPHVQRVTAYSSLKLTDRTATRREYYFTYFGLLENFLISLLKDKKDLPLAYTQLNIVNSLFPMICTIWFWAPKTAVFDTFNTLFAENETAISDIVGRNQFAMLMNIMGAISGIPVVSTITWQVCAGIGYIAFWTSAWLERFILNVHYTCHRWPYHNDFLNKFPLYVLWPIFGVPSAMYYLHHLIMHHGENNHSWDISETESYDRSKVMSVVKYWARFQFLIYFELTWYAVQAKLYGWFVQAAFTFSAHFAICIYLTMYVDPVATFFTLWLPHWMICCILAIGNFSQHILVNPDKPSCNYNLTYNCFNCEGNQQTYNDGYHILHHQYPRMHWTEMPKHFEETIATHREKGAMCFQDIHVLGVGMMILGFNKRGKTGGVEQLARDHYVHLDDDGSTPPTVAEVAEMIRHRLKYIPPYARGRGRGDAQYAELPLDAK